MSLQPERTDLAWRRTGLSTIGLALVGLKLGLDDNGAAGVAAAVLSGAAAAAFAVLARWRATQLREAAAPPPLPPSAGAAVAGTLLAFHLAGLALVLGVG